MENYCVRYAHKLFLLKKTTGVYIGKNVKTGKNAIKKASRRKAWHSFCILHRATPNRCAGMAPFSIKVIILISLLGLSSCSSQIVITGCDAFTIIQPSKLDTLETKRQILLHNKMINELCHE